MKKRHIYFACGTGNLCRHIDHDSPVDHDSPLFTRSQYDSLGTSVHLISSDDMDGREKQAIK